MKIEIGVGGNTTKIWTNFILLEGPYDSQEIYWLTKDLKCSIRAAAIADLFIL